MGSSTTVATTAEKARQWPGSFPDEFRPEAPRQRESWRRAALQRRAQHPRCASTADASTEYKARYPYGATDGDAKYSTLMSLGKSALDRRIDATARRRAGWHLR